MTFNNDDKLVDMFETINLSHKIILKDHNNNINIIKNILNNAKRNINNLKIKNKIIKK
jgi:hypothetical protein